MAKAQMQVNDSLISTARRTNRWTRAAIVFFSSVLFESTLTTGAPPRQLNRSIAMRIIRISILMLASVQLFAFAADAEGKQRRPPRFSDYKVRANYRGPKAKLNLASHPLARRFRTMLREALAGGPNFAGYYAVTYWGCGTDCIQVGIVNVRTGAAYVSPFAGLAGIESRLDSRLLIVGPPALVHKTYDDASAIEQRTYYLYWTGRHLLEIKNGRIGKEPVGGL